MGEERTAPVAVQIVPNDHPPFRDLCITYRRALDSLGVSNRTVVLAPAFREPIPGAVYLGIGDLNRVRRAGRLFEEALAGPPPLLAICHRYRAYRVLRSSGLRPPRVVTVVHEFGFFDRFQRRLEWRLFGRHVLFAGVSPAVQAELGATVPDPVCLPNALDVAELDRTRVARVDALAELGVPASDALTIGLVGRLVRKKSPTLALDALRVLVNRGEDVRLLVIGDGPLVGELTEQAESLPVTFCGFVPEVRRLMAALDVLLLTSQEVEAFGMVALEAMCAAVPVVAGPTPGPQFVLGSSGYYYNRREPDAIAEAICQVRLDLDDGTLRERLTHARERAVREFSVAALARHLDQLFFLRTESR